LFYTTGIATNEGNQMKYICQTVLGFGKNSSIAYVCSKKEKLPNGKQSDWGYTNDFSKALKMQQYLKNCYASDARFCERVCIVTEVNDE
jgi:hypothetical protein